MIRLLTGIFGIVRQVGALDTRLGEAAFRRAYFVYKRYWEDPFAGVIARQPELFRGGDIIDAGANVGYTAALFAGAADAGAQVVAFEPEPYNARLLRAEAARQAGRIVAVEAALGARRGTIALALNPRHHGDHRVAPAGGAGTIAVPLETIDGYWERERPGRPVCFLKIDVQGFEIEVLRGAERTLGANPGCAVAVEYMPEAMADLGCRPEEVLEWFAGRGYQAATITPRGELVEGFSGELPPRGYVDLLFRRAE